jgi:glycosyltransferase involved in cell wall biosynthesis
MDVFALSSDTEQMPIALLEAMASSLPAVATDVGDVRAMLPDAQSRFVVAQHPDGTARFAAALDELAADRELRERLGAANRDRIREQFTLGGMVEQYRALYSDVLRS